VEETDWLNAAPPQLSAAERHFIRAESMAQASEELLGGLLKEVSRSFYLTLRVLPGKVRAPIGLAYLLARTTDTIADTELIALEQRLEALRRLRERIQGQHATPLDFGALAQRQASRAEGVLLEKCEASLTLLDGLTFADRQLVREVLNTIASGQELDLRRLPALHPGPSWHCARMKNWMTTLIELPAAWGSFGPGCAARICSPERRSMTHSCSRMGCGSARDCN
jgi:hypothetical protein